MARRHRGWFTFDNVRRVSEAIAVAARTVEPPDGIDRNALLVVGFDRRFLSRELRRWSRRPLKHRFRVVLSKAPTPSQTISYTAWRRKLLGGVIVTASHNRAKYNGLKFKGWYGGSGLPEMYAAIAAALGSRRRRRRSIENRPARRLRRRTAGAARREEGGDAAHPPRSDVRASPPASRRASSASRWRRSAARAIPRSARQSRADSDNLGASMMRCGGRSRESGSEQ